MINLIFTLDYEIYGNGSGSLEKHIYKPTVELNKIFEQYNLRYVNFIEVAELMKIREFDNDPAIDKIEKQIKEMHLKCYEIALHIHPQWFESNYKNGKWNLNYDEYNLCTLKGNKINSYLDKSLDYLRDVVNDSTYIPLSYRAGNWLIQPSQNISLALANRGIKTESSVFRGGYQHFYSLDFRNYPKNLYYWNFSSDVMQPDLKGKLIEIPIYAEMVYIWKMYSRKRKQIHVEMNNRNNLKYRLFSKIDKIRIKYPKKFDFTKMTFYEMKDMLDGIIEIDLTTPEILKPVVLIGHTKNLFDYELIDKFLRYIRGKKIQIITFREFLKEIEPN